MPTARGVGFFGRTRERERLDAMLAQARDGQSAVVVVRGEPGIGKTALLRYAARQASGLRTTEVEGIQAEMELSFAGIHRLCTPILDGIEVLAEPQQTALRVAWGMASGNAPDRFLVAVAVLNLLSATAEQRPLLCLVDDAQWLDAASVQALGFVARRLVAEPVAMIFSLREPITTRALDGLPQLPIQGLDEPDARVLLSRAAPGPLDDRIRDRIIAETEGNPLALIELSQTMSRSERAGGFAPPADGDLPSQLQDRYLRRISALPTATQRLMLLAAAEPLGDAALLWRAADRLSIDPDAVVPATDAGLLDIDDRVRFHHPLVRSAVYRGASLDDRRRVHDALAEVSDPDLATERRAWHLAAAAAGPDEQVARALEHSAARARARGGFPAAAAFLKRAVALTEDPDRRADRALAAAEAAFQSGAFDEALAQVAMAQALPLNQFQQAQMDLVRGQVAFATGLSGDAPPLLLKAARQLERFDLELARQTYLMGWGAATVAPGRLGESGGLPDISRAILDLPRRPGAPHPLDLLLEGLALLATNGRAAATPTLQRAAKALADIPVEDVLRWGWMATSASNAIWDNDGAYALAARQVQLVRDAGALAELPLHLSALGMASVWNGDLDGAASNLAEADSVAAATGSSGVLWTTLRLRALQGKETETLAAVASAIEQAAAGPENLATYAHWAAAVLYNGLGRYEEAAAAARQAVSSTFEYWVSAWALPELVEAAARTGDAGTALGALERLAETTRPCDTDLALGIETRCRALVSHGTAAEDLYREGTERLRRSNLRPELARSHLVFGEWLRTEGRRTEARNELRSAHTLFVAIGMEAFAERARRELAATGEKLRTPGPPRCDLTPQEEQIARLARDGLTNTQIGTQLFLSPRTVEYHLHKVFDKLGIDSRSGLQAALRGQEPATVRS
jgi:DNA-binding CsgD family transcriptional regulator/tetratricopeptide (TPR) repeat protein